MRNADRESRTKKYVSYEWLSTSRLLPTMLLVPTTLQPLTHYETTLAIPFFMLPPKMLTKPPHRGHIACCTFPSSFPFTCCRRTVLHVPKMFLFFFSCGSFSLKTLWANVLESSVRILSSNEKISRCVPPEGVSHIFPERKH